MGLSNDLIAQFVKVTNDTSKPKKETTVYGTYKGIKDGVKYVQLDGASEETLTPVTASVLADEGDRVIVNIRNHSAYMTGNLTSPALRSDTITDKINEFEIVIASKASLDQLEVEKGRIDDLRADNVLIRKELTANRAVFDEMVADNVEIKGRLDVNEGDIETLKTEKLDASLAEMTYAQITELEATNAEINNLKATHAKFEEATAENFQAVDARIDNLSSSQITVDQLDAKYATVTDLDAEKAIITDLEAEVGDIDTLIFGSATGDTIHSSFANAVVAQLGNAQIKSAMIENVSADKITAGDIITNNVRVKSENGQLLISDETMQISDSDHIRVQIGKDASGDYSINIWDASGNLMFSKGGITDSAIKDAIIRNDMVSDTANIAAHKLDIDSLFEEINGSTKTIKSSRVYLDDKKQSLDVAFTELTTDVDDLQETVSSQGTEISVIQGQISSKIWEQDISSATDALETKTDTLSTQYSTLEQELDGVSATVASHTSTIATKADSSTVTTVDNRVTNLESNLDGFKSTVSDTYATKTTVDNIEVGGRNLILNSSFTKNSLKWAYAAVNPFTFISDGGYGGDGALQLTVTTPSTVVPRQTMSCVFVSGTTLTCSVKVKEIDGVWGTDAYVRWANLFSIRYAYHEMLDNGWTLYVYKAVLAEDLTVNTSNVFGFAGMGNGTFIVDDIKLEKGNRATDWTPAPEDMDSRVSEAENDIATAQAAAEAAQATANQNAEDMASIVTSFNSDISNLQTQIDGSITTWFYEIAPTTTNEPASNWNTTDLKNIHLGDLYYDTVTGYCYRWQVLNNMYSWQRITDTDVTKALSSAQSAQDTADQKRRVFYTQPITPYDAGDLWVQGSSGDILRCKAAKTSAQSYNSSDWIAASKYTDDTVANQAKSDAATAQSGVDELTARVTTAETAITQNKDEIALRATKTEVTEAIDNVHVGGRNLIRYSDTWSGKGSTSNGVTSSLEDGVLKVVVSATNGNWHNFTRTTVIDTTLNDNDEFTFSIEIKSEDGTKLPKIYFKESLGYYSMTGSLSSEYSIAYYSGKWKKANSVSFHFGWSGCSGTYYIRKIKLEKGNKPTDWTPALEDIATASDLGDVRTRVSTAETNITQNSDSITSLASRTTVVENKFANYSTTEQMNSAIQQNADSITSSVSSTYATKMALDTTNSNVANAQSTADQAVSDAATAKNTVDNLEIGGRNLLRNSNFENGLTGWIKTGNDISLVDGYSGNGLQLTITASTTVTPRQIVSLIFKKGDILTGSAKVKVVEGDFSGYVMRFAGGISLECVDSKSLDDEWTLYIYQGTVTADTWDASNNAFGFAYGVSGTYIVDELKLERGNRATDWTPAPEDMTTLDSVENVKNIADMANEKVDVANSLIQQLSDCIATLVTDGNGTSLMTQTENGWTFSTSDLQTSVNATSEALSDLQTTIGTTNNTVDLLKQAVDDLGILSEYIAITTYEGEPCIELGEADSDFKLLITNTRILFKEGSSTPAYMTNQSMHIKKAIVEEELQQAGFVWKVRSNGNLGLTWRGGIN